MKNELQRLGNVRQTSGGRQYFFQIDVFPRLGATGGMQNGKAKTGIAARRPTVLLVAAFAILLFFFAPTEFSIYPRCLFHSITGLNCPGCGSLRAAHQILHGNFYTAFGLNPLFVLALPVFVILSAVRFACPTHGKRITRLLLKPRCLLALLLLAAVFGILRNVSPFSESSAAPRTTLLPISSPVGPLSSGD